MEFICQDLPQYGLVLIPPSSPDYSPLLADIQRRHDQPVDGSPPIPEEFRRHISEEERPTSAILLNQSQRTVAALQVVWRFETVTGRFHRHSHGMLSPQTLLLQFGMREENRKRLIYWHAILPGSRRYLSESGMVGDNTDVRLPAPGEKSAGGGGFGRGRGGRSMYAIEEVRQVTLVLDGVFFLDGEFVGPNREKLLEQTVATAEAYRLVAKIAREGHDQGLPPAQVLAEIEKATGPAPERPAIPPGVRNPDATREQFHHWALQQLAYHLAMQRKHTQFTEERNVLMVLDWRVPHFRQA